MIKYITYNSIDETGQHIIPVNSLYHMNKMAAGTYAPEIMKVILNMKRKPDRYYIVVNALGSYEVWGPNRNGDAFPEAGLSHKSLRTDMATPNDYGYKTFEYYAKFYKHHVNKDPKRSFGEIIFAHWNPVLHRVELIVAIDTVKGADIIEALEKNELVSVSMGCFTDPEYPILTINGYKPIKDIGVGEIVFTHKKRWKKVTKIFRRKYTGKLCKLHFRGLPIPMELTADHPLFGKFFQKDSKGKKRAYITPEQFEKTKFDWAHSEHIEIGDQIQYIPCNYSTSEFSKIDDESLVKLMGYYLAEGSFIYNGDKPCTIQLNCHMDDDLPREVPKLVNKLFPNITCNINPRSNSKQSLCVNINSTELACFMMKYVGKLSKNKFIPPEIFVSDLNIKLSFLGTWLSGDGVCDKKGVHWSSCNLGLVLQARDLLMSCNIPASIYKIKHPAGNGFSHKDTIEYTLNISSIDAQQLLPYAGKKLSKLPNILKERKKNGCTAIRINEDKTYSYSVKDVDVRDVVDIQTYNFEVEDDESYLAAGIVSHNCKVKFDRCSVCGNKARSRKVYCKHAKNYMGQIVTRELADLWSKELNKIILPGTQVFVFNDFPRFFDLSKVFIGADRTSYVLGKAASENSVILSVDVADALGVTDDMVDKFAQVNKKSDIAKNIGGALGPTDIDGRITSADKITVLRKAIDEKMNSTIAAEPKLPKNLIDSMSTALPLQTTLSTLLGLGIHPKPEEFQRIILIRIGEKPLADELDRNGHIFDYEDENIEPQDIDISNRHFSDTLGRLFVPHLSERSCFPEFLEPRIKMIMIKQGQLEHLGEPPKEYKIHPSLKALTGLAALYAGLKLKAKGYGPKQLAEIFTNKSWLRAIIGGGIMYKIFDKIDKAKRNELFLRPATEYEDVLRDTNFSGHFIKQSADPTSLLGYGLLAGALTFPSAYIIRAYHQKALQEKGKGLFPGAGLKPKHMAIAAGAGTAGIPLATQQAFGAIKKKLLKLK